MTAPMPAHAAGQAGGGAAPGSLTGYAFDTCAAPAQEVMDAWRLTSPYSGIGVYVGGSNRLCEQPELDADWVSTQQRQGWHLLPLWVGPQASCSAYAEVMSSDLATAEQQGRAEAAAAVGTAGALGIGRGGTLYYDLEDYDIGPDDCRQAALSFLSGWTRALHASGYRSGVYSSIGAAITSLDFAHRVSRGSYAMPDDIWFAWANGRSDVRTDQRVLSSEWDDHARVHQYAIDVVQAFGGYPMSIDANWVDVGRGSVAPRSRPLCRGVDADLRRYPTLRTGRSGDAVRAAQCLLRRQHVTRAPITGRYDARTAAAVRKAQRRLDLPDTGRLTRSTWTALLARGSHPLLKVGDTGSAVLRLQRALTAALGRPVRIDGVVDKGTARAVKAFQRKTGLSATGVVTPEVWDALT
ncbi:glycoside hydrolase domain-containing protein [Nocardioides sp. Soil805]|uniref:glycoside hydrolase domain-containing protein n=1 Tax=Nocardioides sp. Soil805 TaxID=1736416 RepID=UPI00138F944D|nr:glycoside hydrolase domain-containing protein [Nocardioides sp. Soil805]